MDEKVRRLAQGFTLEPYEQPVQVGRCNKNMTYSSREKASMRRFLNHLVIAQRLEEPDSYNRLPVDLPVFMSSRQLNRSWSETPGPSYTLPYNPVAHLLPSSAATLVDFDAFFLYQRP